MTNIFFFMRYYILCFMLQFFVTQGTAADIDSIQLSPMEKDFAIYDNLAWIKKYKIRARNSKILAFSSIGVGLATCYWGLVVEGLATVHSDKKEHFYPYMVLSGLFITTASIPLFIYSHKCKKKIKLTLSAHQPKIAKIAPIKNLTLDFLLYL